MLYWENNFTGNLNKNQWSPRYFRLEILGSLYQDLGRAYGNIMANQQKLFFYLSKSIEIHKAHEDTLPLALDYNTLAEYFLSTNQLDSCLFYAQKAYALQTQKRAEIDAAYTLGLIGAAYFGKGNYSQSINLLQLSIKTYLKYETEET